MAITFTFSLWAAVSYGLGKEGRPKNYAYGCSSFSSEAISAFVCETMSAVQVIQKMGLRVKPLFSFGI